MKCVNIKIYGRVQGVSFRYYAYQQARELAIVGFIRNMPDGTTYIEAEGKEKNLKKFIARCRQGPPLAQVEKITYKFLSTANNFSRFEIL